MILLCDLEKLVLVSTYKKKVKQVMVPLKHVHFPQRSTTSAGLHLINLLCVESKKIKIQNKNTRKKKSKRTQK